MKKETIASSSFCIELYVIFLIFYHHFSLIDTSCTAEKSHFSLDSQMKQRKLKWGEGVFFSSWLF